MKTVLFAFFMLLATSAMADNVTVTFTWTAPGDDGNVGTCAGYEIRYSTSVITDANWNAATPITASTSIVPKVAGSAETWTTPTPLNLTSQTTYHFAIRAKDEANNWNGTSNDKTYTTLDTTAPAAIINFNATFTQ